MTALIEDHGSLILFLIVLAEQVGLPVPAIPAMMVAGALVADGRGSLVSLLAVSVSASVLGDYICYAIGRLYGWPVMKLLCGISLSPDSCVRQTSVQFERWGGWSLVLGKFIPGIGTIAPPLSGVMGMPWGRFLFLSFLGSALWVGVSVAAGLLFHAQINEILETLERYGSRAAAAFVALLALYISFKWWERQRFYKMLRMARITVDELNALLERREEPLVVDLRPPAVRLREGAIPGAHFVRFPDVSHDLAKFPKDREIIFFCNCPNEASAAGAAKQLIDLGYTRVRPLVGGFSAWVTAGYKVVVE